VRTLRQYWEEIFTARKISSVPEGQPVFSPEGLEREISAIGSEIQGLVGEVHRLRSDVERIRDQENSKSYELDLINSRFETAMEAVNRNTHTILDLEARFAGLASERDQARDEGRGLENSHPGTSDRMETTDKYVRDLEVRLAGLESERDQAREKVGGLENSVSDASDRMETTDKYVRDLEVRLAGLESERDQARDKVGGLENSVSDASDRMKITDKHIRDLEARFAGLESERHQVRDKVGVLENSVTDTSDRMEITNNHVRDLEDRLKSKHEDYQNTFQGMLLRFRKQDLRINRTMFFTAIALLLGAVSVVILVWDVQRNAALHSSMRKELKELGGSIEGHLSLQHNPQEEKQQLILPETPHSAPGEKAAAKPEKPKYSKKPRFKIDNAYPPDKLIDLLNQ
jgi:predicted  nucleic acid-binding Zn-ribbon protein